MLSLLLPIDRRGQAGFHQLSDHPASLLDPGQDPGLRSNTPGHFQQ
jgi:hypothetical protein